MRNRIETRPAVIEIDEEAIKAAFLAGQRPSDIAGRSSSYARYSRIANFISANRQRWLEESRWQSLTETETKIVIRRHVATDAGAGLVMPISLPRISMHILAMREAAQS